MVDENSITSLDNPGTEETIEHLFNEILELVTIQQNNTCKKITPCYHQLLLNLQEIFC